MHEFLVLIDGVQEIILIRRGAGVLLEPSVPLEHLGDDVVKCGAATSTYHRVWWRRVWWEG